MDTPNHYPKYVFLVQCVVWFAAAVLFFCIPLRWYSGLPFCLPIGISLIAWGNLGGLWRWRAREVVLKPLFRPRRKLACAAYTAMFTLLLVIPFSIAGQLDRDRSIEVVEQARSEALRIHSAALNVALDRDGTYPKSMAELPREHPVQNGWTESNGMRLPMMEGLDDKTIADEDKFVYFGDGLTTRSPPGIVVVASRNNLPGAGHLLYTNDDKEFWVGPNGFAHIQPYLKNHVPVSDWKN